MSDPSLKDDETPAEIDFSRGVRSLHTIPLSAKVFMPASIERSVWEYFSRRAEREGIGLSELLTNVLKSSMPVGGDALK